MNLEFQKWQNSCRWGYSNGLGMEWGLRANQRSLFTVPVLHELPFASCKAWREGIRALLSGLEFDQVWYEAVHSPLDQNDLDWIAELAPVRVAFVPENMLIRDAERQANPVAAQKREAQMDRSLKIATHIMAVDLEEVTRMNSAGKIPVKWWGLTGIAEEFIATNVALLNSAKPLMYGALYKRRTDWLERFQISELIERPSRSLEWETEYPALYDKLMETVPTLFSGSLEADRSAYEEFMHSYRYLKATLYSLWLKTLRNSGVILNPPTYMNAYASRFLEGIASGCAVIAPRLDPKYGAVGKFVDGRDVLLYDLEDAMELRSHIDRLSKDSKFAENLALNGLTTMRKHYTARETTRSILDWIEETRN
ncbi:MAG: glycosyltransferase [Bdellovibrionales bacterium]|nr:glycosyltransferase [Bdellovibrionales bacterium]